MPLGHTGHVHNALYLMPYDLVNTHLSPHLFVCT